MHLIPAASVNHNDTLILRDMMSKLRSLTIPALFFGFLSACAMGVGGAGPEPRHGPPEGVPATVAVNPDGVTTPTGAPAGVKIGLALWVSGQVAFDSTGTLIGPGDLRLQTDQALENLIQVVHAAHGVPADVVKLTAYVVADSTASDQFHTIQSAITARFKKETPPAVTVVTVAGLAPPGALVAIDGIAMLRGEIPDRWRDSP